MSYFKGITNAVDAKKLYKELCKKLHPDVGGSTAAFQELNRQYLEGNKRGWTGRTQGFTNNPTGSYKERRNTNSDSFSKSQAESKVAKYKPQIDFVANKARENNKRFVYAKSTLLLDKNRRLKEYVRAKR